MKRLVLLLFSSFIGIVGVPEILTGADTVEATGLSLTGIVETAPPIVEEPEKAPIDNSNNYSQASINANQSLPIEMPVTPVAITQKSAPVSSPAVASSVSPVLNDEITFFGHTVSIVNVSSTAVDAGNHVNRFREKFLYGHNSSAVFGGLVNLNEGGRFTVRINGVTKTYAVVEKVIYEKASATSLRLNGKDYSMSAIVKGRGKYNMVLMTCYGVSYGNGDASHRLVIYANEG